MRAALAVDVLMGAQWGSESKGLFATHIGGLYYYDWLVSCATRNAGHTAYTKNGQKLVARYLPSSAVTNRAPILIAAGTCLHMETLEAEIKQFEDAGVSIRDRLCISTCAGVLTADHEHAEHEGKKDVAIGSTCEGVGEALVDRVRRCAPLFRDLYYDKYTFMDDLALRGEVLLECSQGYLLSNLSRMYPYTTSRVCNASAYMSYAKLPPQSVRDVYGVFRTWPIRVANRTIKPLDDGSTSEWDPSNSSGSMNGREVEWETVREFCGATEEQLPIEITTVTKLPRRIASWRHGDAMDAIRENGITRICLSFLNYVDWGCYGARSFHELTDKAKQWVRDREAEIGMQFDLLSTDPYGVFPRLADTRDIRWRGQVE